jgi:hypothetical protein
MFARVSARELAAVAAVATIMTLVMATPVLRSPSERVFGADIVGRHHDPFTVMAQFQRPIALGTYVQPLTDIPGALLARLFHPVTAYNWLVLATFPLSAAAAYALARHLMMPATAAALAAFAFAFSPFHLAQAAYHVHVAQTQWIPLYLLALFRCLDRSTAATIGLLALSAVGVALSNFYGGLIAGVMTPMAVAGHWYFISRDEAGSRRRVLITLASLGALAFAGAAYAWIVAPAVVAAPDAFAVARDDLVRYGATWRSYVVPPVVHPLFGDSASRVWIAAGVGIGLLEQQLSLGVGLMTLAAVSIYAWWRRRRRVAALIAVPLIATIGLFALVFSLSPQGTLGPFTVSGPSAFLYDVVPMFRAYARFGVVVQLMIALLAGIGADWLWRRDRRPAKIIAAALVVLTAIEYMAAPAALSRDVWPTRAHRWLAHQPEPVRALDCAPLTADSPSLEWLSEGRISPRQWTIDDCDEPDISAKLAAAGYTHMLIRQRPDGQAARAATAAGLQSLARFDDSEVLAVTAPPPLVYTRQVTAFYPRESDVATTWRWMGPAASWTIMNTAHRELIASVDIELTAFHRARQMTLRLDGRPLQTVTVAASRSRTRIGPMALPPGEHQLTFEPVEPPVVADDLMKNGDRRPLSIAVGRWSWTVEGTRR